MLRSTDAPLGFCLELYAYILITSSCKPRGSSSGCALQYDQLHTSLTKLGIYPNPGTMFGDSYALSELIPQVTLLAARRLSEETAGAAPPSPNLLLTHGILESRIESWELPLSSQFGANWEEPKIAAEAIRSGLRIYLATALAGSIVSDPKTLNAIQSHIDSILDCTNLLASSRWTTILLWPIVIAGSCMTDSTQRCSFIESLKASRYCMRHVFAVCEVLESLWDIDIPQAFGPYGLYLMEQKGYWIPVL